MEALVRWRPPTRGLISPVDFIPLAEETALIIPLGQWVLREACRQNKLWQQRGLRPLRIAVNISGAQLRHGGIIDHVALALRETGLDARYLEIEITESVVMQNASSAVAMLDRLSQMGVHLAVDDFGTGYSSLSYLNRFPLNTLKIDSSFVRTLLTDRNGAVIVEAIIALAHSLKLEVVAEGGEEQAQLNFLQTLGSDQYQGFLHSKPLTATEFLQHLEADAGDEAPEPALP